jgi:dTDP-4-dehydrorhamnose reductase
MSPKYLLIGSTGMLGKAFREAATDRGNEIIGIARSGADINIDISDAHSLLNTLESVKPDIIINTVAIVSLEYCENHPSEAYLINTRPSAILAEYCRRNGVYLIHISTDHFFSGDKRAKHDEKSAVTLMNEYARTKYLAEKLVETYPDSLIIRTNIVGFKSSERSQSFVEWIIESLESGKSITLFDDYYTSSIDVCTLSRIILDLSAIGAKGLLNVGSRDVSSKKEFILQFASQFGYDISHTKTGTVKDLAGIQRCESLGLDVSNVEDIIGYRMPLLDEVICNLYNEYKLRELQ